MFGVNCEAIPRQVNFLTDESGEAGRGANAVISHLHFFFEEHGLGEKSVHLHAELYRTKQKQQHDGLLDVEGNDWTTYRHNLLFLGSGTYEVQPRLVLWAVQASF